MKSYKQLQIMGRCLMESIRMMDGRCIFSVVKKNIMDLYEAAPSDLDGVIDELRTTEGVEVAILLSERAQGHIRAAGCSLKGTAFDVINSLTFHIEKQLELAKRQAE